MSGFLLDTNVLSEFNRRAGPNPGVQRWLRETALGSLYVSVITLAEVRLGIELLPFSRRRSELEEWIGREFDAWFRGRLVPIDAAIVNRWAAVTAHRQRAGRPLANFDGLLAATAMEHGLTLATRNIKDFVDLEITLNNPWQTS